MPSVSKAQQRFFGVVRSVQRGDTPMSKVSKSVKDAAKTMKRKDVKDFAETKHKNLPEKVKKQKGKKMKNESFTPKQKFDLLTESLSNVRENTESYNQLFYKKLQKYGVSSPDELDEETKKAFFNELDNEWESEEEKQNGE